jgi:hypothetical protein
LHKEDSISKVHIEWPAASGYKIQVIQASNEGNKIKE